jgi:hypothetical protein
MNNLPHPPVPQKLREMLKDYPEYVDELQQALNRLIAAPMHGTPLFEQAIWVLEAALESFISEARDELKIAQANGAPDEVERAKAKELLMLHASGLRGLHDLHAYIKAKEGGFR